MAEALLLPRTWTLDTPLARNLDKRNYLAPSAEIK